MAGFWRLSAESRGLVVTVEATIEGTNEDSWRGEVTTVPFDTIEAQGPGFGPVRDRLAAAVLVQAVTGIMPLPAGSLDAVRVMATSVTHYPRGVEREGPQVSIPAIADRDAAGPAGPHSGTLAARRVASRRPASRARTVRSLLPVAGQVRACDAETLVSRRSGMLHQIQ